MCIVNHFRNKILSSQRNVHIIQILGRMPPKKDYVEGIVRLCVENVMHVLDPVFFQIKSRCWKTLHIQGIGGHIWPNRFCT